MQSIIFSTRLEKGKRQNLLSEEFTNWSGGRRDTNKGMKEAARKGTLGRWRSCRLSLDAQ